MIRSGKLKIENRKKRCSVFVIIAIMLILVSSNKTNVMAASKRTSTTKTFWWPVPNGGHTSAKIKLIYEEKYKISGKNTIFTSRERTILFSSVAATSSPKFSFGTLKHSNGKNFTSWKRKSMMYSSDWDSGSYQSNGTDVKYVRTTKVKGTLNASVYCSGGVVPTRAVSVTQRLNTK